MNDYASTTPPGDAADEDEVQTAIQNALGAAVSFQEGTLVPRWNEATDLYRGEATSGLPTPPEGDERSRYMARDVHDTVMAMLPEVVNVFLSDEDAVIRYQPTSPADVQLAELATEYVAYLMRRFGSRAIIDAIQDALRVGLGVIKVAPVEKVTVRENSYKGLTRAEFEALLVPADAMESDVPTDETTVEVVSETTTMLPGPMTPDPFDPMAPPIPGPEVESIDAKIKTIKRRTTISLVSMPPEERVVSENARDLDTAYFAAHVRKVSIHELIGMGYDADDFSEVNGLSFTFLDDAQQKRVQDSMTTQDDEEETPGDPNSRRVVYAECYILADFDGDGRRSRYKVCVAGDNATVVRPPVVVESIPWAELCPYPEPHTTHGFGVAEVVGDIQISNTVLMRALFDSLGQALFPPRGYNQNAVVDERQLLNTGPGINIAFEGSPEGQLKELTREFQGAAIMPVLGLMGELRENRTGVSKAAAGLNPDALQSTTRVAVAATVSKAEAQTMMVARNLAAGFERLGKLVLQAMVTAPASADMMQLSNGEWRKVDPAAFNPDMQVYVDTARGRGDNNERSSLVKEAIGFQVQALEKGSSITSEQKLYNAIYDAMRFAGIVDPNRYFTDPSTEPPKQPVPPPPDPAMVLAEAQLEEAKAESLRSVLRSMTDLLNVLLGDDQKRDQADLSFIGDMAKLETTQGVPPESLERITTSAKMQGAMVTNRPRNFMEYLQVAMQIVQAVKAAETVGVKPPVPPPPPGPPMPPPGAMA